MTTGHRRLYLRTDLDRILHTPRYNRRGAIHQAARDSIAETGL